MKTFSDMTKLFERANDSLLQKDRDLFIDRVSERTLCGALMIHIHDVIKNDKSFDKYYVDVEYNRNKGAIKTICETNQDIETKIIRINCDLILHSRGKHIEQDNLIAIEMKKSNRSEVDKQKDKDRLIALTKDSFDDVWSYDGRSLPKHVCRYVLGVYYEINYNHKEIMIEYYRQGNLVKSYTKLFNVKGVHERNERNLRG